jgi:hypothetical protein
MKIVADAKSRWKHYSTQALALGASIQGAWIAFPDDLKLATFGAGATEWVGKATAVILLWGLVGKFIDQGPKDGNPS